MSNRRKIKRSQARVLIAGEGIVATPIEQRFEAVAHAEMPVKRPGRHRWIATASYVLSDLQVAKAHDPDTMKFLDHENLFFLGIGCWDCEQPLGEIQPGSRCPVE